jgi:hypothetical protein
MTVIAVTDLLAMAQAKFGLLFWSKFHKQLWAMRKGFPTAASIRIYLGTASEAEPLQSCETRCRNLAEFSV